MTHPVISHIWIGDFEIPHLHQSTVPPHLCRLFFFLLFDFGRQLNRSKISVAFVFELMTCLSPWPRWQAGLVHCMKYETGWGQRWQPCHKASVRMTGPKTPACSTDISAANRKVQALTAAGPKDGEKVNNLAVAICWGESNVKVSFHPSPALCVTVASSLTHSTDTDSSHDMERLN